MFMNRNLQEKEAVATPARETTQQQPQSPSALPVDHQRRLKSSDEKRTTLSLQVQEATTPAPVPSQEQPAEGQELLFYGMHTHIVLTCADETKDFDPIKWSEKLSTLNKACSVCLQNNTQSTFHLVSKTAEGCEWLRLPTSSIPPMRSVIIGTYGKSMSVPYTVSLHYSLPEGDPLIFKWEAQRGAFRVERIESFAQPPFSITRFHTIDKYTDIIFRIQKEEGVRMRSGTFGFAL